MSKCKTGRPASYSREQVRDVLTEMFRSAGRVPTDLPQVSVSDVLPVMSARFGTSEKVRPESLQSVIDDIFDEMVQHQRAQDRSHLTEGQRDQMSLLTACLDAALVEAFTKENDRLARAQFEIVKRCDGEKDFLKEELSEAKESLRYVKARIADLSAEL